MKKNSEVTFYDRAFFNNVEHVSRSTARKIVPFLLKLAGPKSVVDVGCGTGAWLKTFKELGVADLCGYDGDWAIEVNANGGFQFVPADVSRPIQTGRRFDLAVSIEVGEHLPAVSAPTLVESLVSLSDLVVFSAAIPGQGGTNHVNEQWPPFWIDLFRQRGYVAYDCFRASFWEDGEVDPCVAQNTFLYVKEDSKVITADTLERIRAASVLRLVSVVNPRLFHGKLELLTKDVNTMTHFMTFRQLLKLAPGLLRNSLVHHGGKLFGASK